MSSDGVKLLDACKNGNMAEINRLLDKGVSANFTDAVCRLIGVSSSSSFPLEATDGVWMA
jgi:DNA-binding transcriptional ArsR family regulator